MNLVPVLFDVRFLGDASKNLMVWVRGEVRPGGEGKHTEFLDLHQVAVDAQGREARTLILCSALWTLQEKLGIYIWTEPEAQRRPEKLLLLMESRNYIRSERGIILDPWQGKLYMEFFNVTEPKWFWFQLEFDKAFRK